MSSVYCNISFLNVTFPNRWIGRGGPTPWPPRSPDITPLDLFLWRYVKDKYVSDTSSRYYKSEGKNNRRFCYTNWRHVGEHVERNWLSIRRSPCNKGAHVEVYWCVVKNFLSYILKYIYIYIYIYMCVCLYSTYSSFLVIEVCNQGKTLCSPCI